MRAHLWPCLAAAISGCGGGEEARLTLRLLYAANPEAAEAPTRPWAGYGCATEPEQGDCVAVRLSACDPDSDECISVVPEASEGDDARIANLQGGTFDLPTKAAARADLLLQVGMYGEGRLLATGEARQVSFADGERVPLTLFPVGAATACAEPGGRNTEQLSRRAFHTATLLPNGEVLLIGGLSGPILKLSPDDNALEESVDVLDPRTGLVADHLEVVNQAPDETGPQIFRAFHHAAYLRTEPDGRYVIRLFGGIRAAGSEQSARVSSARDETPLQVMVVGRFSADPAPPVDVVYDPANRSVTVVAPEADADAVPRASFGGFAALTEELGSDTRPGGVSVGFYVGGGLGEWAASGLMVGQVEPVLDGFVANQNGGTLNPAPAPLRVGRIGTTAIGIGSEEVLFWGGNGWSVEGAAEPEVALAEEIAEVHRPTGDDAPVVIEPTGLEVPSTAFHAAAVASVDGDGTRRIVVAGGYMLTSAGDVWPGRFAPEPLYLVSYSPAERRIVVSDVVCRNWEGDPSPCTTVFGDVAYATVTWMSPGRVLIVGGNSVYTYESEPSNRETKYAARAVAGVVTVAEDNAIFQPVALGGARYGHSATRLADGSVLILGGVALDCAREDGDHECDTFGDLTPLATYEVYNDGLSFPAEQSCAPEP